jgi:hypothetical protein
VTPGERLAERINDGFRKYLQEHKRSMASPASRASELGHACERYLVLSRTHGHLAAKPSDRLQSIFLDGHRREPQVKRLLSEIGIDLHGAQRSFPPNSYEITGHIDGEWYENSADGTDVIVIEIKGLNGPDFDRIAGSHDRVRTMLDKDYLRKWFTQDQLYMLLRDAVRFPGEKPVEEAVFVLQSKATGELLAVPLKLDLEYLDPILDRAERIRQHVKDGTLPGYATDPSVCRRCPFFGGVCVPETVAVGEGVIVVTDEAMVEAAETVVQLAEVAKKYEAARDVLHACVEALAGKEKPRELIVGDVMVATSLRKIPANQQPKPRAARVDLSMKARRISVDVAEGDA